MVFLDRIAQPAIMRLKGNNQFITEKTIGKALSR
jgi:hypothetical protein